MDKKRWYNIAIFLQKKSAPSILGQYVYPQFLSLYKENQNLHFFFNIDQSRGPCIVLFLEYPETAEPKVILFYHTLVQAINPASTAEMPVALSGDATASIFKDVTPGHVAYGLFKLKTIPFTHFTKEKRDVYFAILKAVSLYILSRETNDFRYIIENDFLFCFALVYDICCASIKLNSKFEICYHEAITNEIKKASNAVGRSLENGLLKAYQKNKDILSEYSQRPLHSNTLSGLASSSVFADLVLAVSSQINTSSGDMPDVLFVQTVMIDICAILNLQNYLTCLFFVRCKIEEQFHKMAIYMYVPA